MLRLQAVKPESMAQDMTLLWGSGSPPCWRVMIALEEKNLQGYSHKLLSFEKMEHKSQEVLDMNPRGQVGSSLKSTLTCEITTTLLPHFPPPNNTTPC